MAKISKVKLWSIAIAFVLVSGLLIGVWLTRKIHTVSQQFQAALSSAQAAGIEIKEEQIPAGRLAGLSSRSPAYRPYIQAAFAATKLSTHSPVAKKFQFDQPNTLTLAEREEIAAQCSTIDALIAKGNEMPTDDENVQGPMAERQQFFTLGSIQYIANVLAFQIDAEAKSGQFELAGQHLTSLFGIAQNVGNGGSYSLQVFSSIVARIGLSQTLNCMTWAKGNAQNLAPIFNALAHFPTPKIGLICKYEWINNQIVFSSPTPIHATAAPTDNPKNITPWQMNFEWMRREWAIDYLHQLTQLQKSLAASPPNWPANYIQLHQFAQSDVVSERPLIVLRQQLCRNLVTLYSTDTSTEALFRLTVRLAKQLALDMKVNLPAELSSVDLTDPISGQPLTLSKTQQEFVVQTNSNLFMSQGASGPIYGPLTLKLNLNPGSPH